VILFTDCTTAPLFSLPCCHKGIALLPKVATLHRKQKAYVLCITKMQ